MIKPPPRTRSSSSSAFWQRPEFTPWAIERKIKGGFALAVVMLAAMGAAAYWNTRQLIETAGLVDQTNSSIAMLKSLQADLSGAESGQRGYLLTDNEQHLEAYYLSINALRDSIRDLRQLAEAEPEQQAQIQIVENQVSERLASLQTVLNTYEREGFAAAQDLIEQDIGRQLSADFQASVQTLLLEAEQWLEERTRQAEINSRNTVIAVGLSGIFALIFVPVAGGIIIRDISARRQIEAKLQDSQQQLKQWLIDLEQRRSEISQLGELSDVLQACFTLEEAYRVLGELVQRLFPNTVGGVFIISESKTLVEAVATWGELPQQAKIFGPADCWALRRGRPYFLDQGHSGLRCEHLSQVSAQPTVCVPMMAQGEALGILHLMPPSHQPLSPEKQLLTTTVAEHVAIAIANLKLRQTLKNQSIRDPLTGLFNRRYMEEALDLEIKRSQRGDTGMGLIMLDVDHFKRFNDTFGHEAGDLVLRELGSFLQSMIRNSDIGCRYGGEEFMLLLPEASLEATHQRAEQVRLGVKQLKLEFRRQPLGPVNLSLGVACLPQHGTTAEDLIRAADTALYQAKGKGRDQVVIAKAATVPQLPSSLG